MDRRTEQFRRGVRAVMEGGQFMFIQDGATFYVCNPETKETHTVRARECSCGDFEHRCRREQLRCKHVLALEIFASRIERIAA